MAYANNWGKIYESSYWGIGVTSNPISWGIIYLNDASGGASELANRYEERVEADGGNVESKECLTQDYSVYNWTYYFRVTDDGGNVESLECVPITY
jgi:hypothetical protein